MSARQVKTEIVRIDAKIAAHMLEFNKEYKTGVSGTNRRTSNKTVAKFAGAMLRGEWKLTHQGIAFLEDGSLDDGQHRLKAIILAAQTNPDISVEMMVTTGLEHGIFAYIDTGLRRRLADVASSAGLKNSFQVAATARLFHCYMIVPYDNPASWSSMDQFSASVMMAVLEKYPSIVEGAARVRQVTKFPGNLTALSTGYALACELRPDADIEAFMRKLGTGLGYTRQRPEDDPVYRLREKLTAADRIGKNHDRVVQLAWFIKAFNREVAGLDMKMLGFAKNEAFPRISAEGSQDDATSGDQEAIW